MKYDFKKQLRSFGYALERYPVLHRKRTEPELPSDSYGW